MLLKNNFLKSFIFINVLVFIPASSWYLYYYVLVSIFQSILYLCQFQGHILIKHFTCSPQKFFTLFYLFLSFQMKNVCKIKVWQYWEEILMNFQWNSVGKLELEILLAILKNLWNQFSKAYISKYLKFLNTYKCKDLFMFMPNYWC